MKKKIISLFFLICLVFVESVGVADTNMMKSIYLSGVQISIAVPKDYITHDRTDKLVDPRLDEIGFDLSAFQETMKKYDVYLYAYSPDLESDINVVVMESEDTESWDNESGTSLALQADSLVEQFNQLGISASNLGIESFNGHLFTIMHATYGSEDKIQVGTVVDHQIITITLSRFNGECTPEDKDLLMRVLECSEFNKMERTTGVFKLNDFQDDVTGVHFGVPEGWETELLDVDEQPYTTRVKMTPVGDTAGSSIIFSCADIWNLSIEEGVQDQLGITSREGCLSWNEPAMVAVMNDADIEEVEMEHHGGLLYGVFTARTEKDGETIEYPFASTFYNGFWIQIRLYDPLNLYRDLMDQIMESVFFDSVV